MAKTLREELAALHSSGDPVAIYELALELVGRIETLSQVIATLTSRGGGYDDDALHAHTQPDPIADTMARFLDEVKGGSRSRQDIDAQLAEERGRLCGAEHGMFGECREPFGHAGDHVYVDRLAASDELLSLAEAKAIWATDPTKRLNVKVPMPAAGSAAQAGDDPRERVKGAWEAWTEEEITREVAPWPVERGPEPEEGVLPLRLDDTLVYAVHEACGRRFATLPKDYDVFDVADRRRAALALVHRMNHWDALYDEVERARGRLAKEG